jgi:hypothetical protein
MAIFFGVLISTTYTSRLVDAGYKAPLIHALIWIYVIGGASWLIWSYKSET